MSAKPKQYVARKQRRVKPKVVEVKVVREDAFPPVLHNVEIVREKPEQERPDRAGKRPLHAYIPTSMHRRLRQLALDHDTTTTALTLEALTDLFAKKRKA